MLAPQNATKEDLDEIRKERGLDKPIHVQYWKWISSVVVGDFGESLRWKMPAINMFADRFPNTLRLGLAGFSFAVIMGLGVGIISAVKVGRKFDSFGKVFALLGQALPGFWVAIMFIHFIFGDFKNPSHIRDGRVEALHHALFYPRLAFYGRFNPVEPFSHARCFGFRVHQIGSNKRCK